MAETLGAVKREFKPDLSNLIAGVILGLGMIFGGIAAAVYLAGRDDPKPLAAGETALKYGVIGLLGLGVPCGGAILLYWMKQLLSHKVIIHEHGFVYDYGNEHEVCFWDDAAEINETLTHEDLKVLKVPGGRIKNVDRSLRVVRKDGKEFVFTVNSLSKHGVGMVRAFLQTAQSDFGIPWHQVEE